MEIGFFFFTAKTEKFVCLNRLNHKSNISDILMRRLMPTPMDYKTLVNVEMGFLYV